MGNDGLVYLLEPENRVMCVMNRAFVPLRQLYFVARCDAWYTLVFVLLSYFVSSFLFLFFFLCSFPPASEDTDAPCVG